MRVVSVWWSDSLCFSVWIHCVWTQLNLETNGTVEHLIIKRFLSVCGGLFSSLSVCGSSRLWTELNLETNGTVKHFIIKRFLSICGGLILSLSVCGSYRLWTLFDIETNETVEHLIIKRFLSMCGCLYLFLSVCRFIRLWIELNLETIGTVEHEILQVFPVNMCRSYSLCTSVWMLPPVNLSNVVSVYLLCILVCGSIACEQNSIKCRSVAWITAQRHVKPKYGDSPDI